MEFFILEPDSYENWILSLKYVIDISEDNSVDKMRI